MYNQFVLKETLAITKTCTRFFLDKNIKEINEKRNTSFVSFTNYYPVLWLVSASQNNRKDAKEGCFNEGTHFKELQRERTIGWPDRIQHVLIFASSTKASVSGCKCHNGVIEMRYISCGC